MYRQLAFGRLWGAFVRRMLLLVGCALVVFGLSPAQAEPVAIAQAVDEGLTFVPTAPVRVLDTRTGVGTGGEIGPIQSGLFLDLTARVPASATTVVLNLTGTQPTVTTRVQVAPTNVNLPDISSLYLVPGETRATQVTVKVNREVSGERQIFLYNRNNTGTVHLIADLAGYYTTDAAARFTSIAPRRVLDTRATAPVGPASTVEVNLSGVVPASATAVTINLTGTAPTSNTYVTAYPSGTTLPTASSLNLAAGQTVPNLVTVAVGANRRITLYNSVGRVHLIADLAGYYAPDRGDRFFPVSSVRATDTRAAGGPLGAGGTRVVDLASRIPTTATAAVLNLTGTPTASTYVTAFPTGSTRPLASNLNLAPQRDTANGAVVALGTGARVTLYNDIGSTHLLVDVAGFFASPVPCVDDCLYGWGGSQSYGLTPARRPWLSGVTKVAAANETAYALRSDGTVWSWGDNQFGQLGAGATSGDSTVPLRVAGLTGVTAIAAGTWAGYALKSDGTVWAWGSDNAGQLGQGYVRDSNVPVRVWELTDVTAIAASHQTAYALRADGTVWAWGSDLWDGLGGGTCPTGQTCPPHTPVRVSLPLPGTTRITAIAAGNSETAYALRSDGTMWAWGRNWLGETGTGAPPRTSILPTQVVGLTDVVTIGAGTENGYAVTADGRVWSWGEDYWGALGTGAQCTQPEECRTNVPVTVPGLTAPIAIDGTDGATLALSADGTVWAWGRNGESGNLGNGTSGECRTIPFPASCRQSTPVRTTIANATAIATGGLGQFAIAAP
jgi:alpha-tubulin suppressor-like RCC1 family protein